MDDTPIADLFPHRVFADIAGFTSWSSCREPTQVFIFFRRFIKPLICKTPKSLQS
jgi:hypothetical protein